MNVDLNYIKNRRTKFMWVEISITLFIIAIAGHIIYHSLKSKGSGDCGCENCSSKKKSN